jgi:hypothetical protein
MKQSQTTHLMLIANAGTNTIEIAHPLISDWSKEGSMKMYEQLHVY